MAFSKFATDREERINYDRMRQYRLRRAKEEMKKAGLGALVTWDAYSIRYLTGAYISIPMRWPEANCVVLPVDGDPIIYGGSSGSPYRMREEMPWLKGQIYTRLATVKMTRTKEDLQNLVKEVARIMDEHGVRNRPLGIEGTTSALRVQEAFKENGIKLVDSKEIMLEARKIKSRDEIECIRIACANAEAAFADIRDAIRPGITECELVGVGMKALYSLGADEAMEFVCISGELTNPFRIDYTERQIRPGDLIIVDINGNSFQGYKSCYYRTFCCGKPTAEQREIFEENRAMLYAGMSAVKAGNTTFDICSKWPNDPKYWGYDNWHDVFGLATGHGVGLALQEYPYPIQYAFASQNPVKLEEGMVIALETWTGKKGGRDAVRLEEQMVVTNSAYDLLTKFPINELVECWM